MIFKKNKLFNEFDPHFFRRYKKLYDNPYKNQILRHMATASPPPCFLSFFGGGVKYRSAPHPPKKKRC